MSSLRPRWLSAFCSCCCSCCGAASIVNEGSTYRVDQPEVVTMAEAIDDFPPKEQRMLRVFGVDKSLRVQRSELQDT